MPTGTIQRRASLHAALGDPARLAIVDELAVSDRSPVELCQMFDIGSNLLAHHLDVLEDTGLIERSRSSGDGRRRYVHLRPDRLAHTVPGRSIAIGPAMFICTANSARSQLAAAAWQEMTGAAAESAGTHPAATVHPGAVAAAERAGLDLSGSEPRRLAPDGTLPALVVTVCDRAHEELAGKDWLHWSIPDPVPDGSAAAFDRALRELMDRIDSATNRERLAS